MPNATCFACTALSFGLASGLVVAVPFLFMLLAEDNANLGSRVGPYARLGLLSLMREVFCGMTRGIGIRGGLDICKGPAPGSGCDILDIEDLAGLLPLMVVIWFSVSSSIEGLLPAPRQNSLRTPINKHRRTRKPVTRPLMLSKWLDRNWVITGRYGGLGTIRITLVDLRLTFSRIAGQP